MEEAEKSKKEDKQCLSNKVNMKKGGKIQRLEGRKHKRPTRHREKKKFEVI